MRAKTAISGSLSNKRALTDAEINAGFAFNTILESPDFNGQLFDIDDQVDIISKEICNFLTGHSVTPVGTDSTQLGTLLDSLFGAKQDKLTAGQNITIDANNVISTTGATALNFPLFATMWLYSKPFNSSWVNANNYSWLYASMYVSAYNFLVSQLHPTGKAEQGSTYYVLRFDNGEGETTNVLAGSGTLSDLQTYCTSQGYTYNAAATIEEFECYKTLTTSSETISGITITYYETYNGMKIITDAAEITNEETLYNLIGVDNYFILDEANNRFKLPRTQYGFIGIRNKVGEYVPETLPNIKGGMTLDHVAANTFSGALSETLGNQSNYGHDSYAQTHYIKFNAHDSNSVYQDSAPVQQRATQMYLYFYLGDTGEIVDHQIASIALELFNGKVDTDLNNVSHTAGLRRLVQVYNVGTDWYKVYDEYIPTTGQYIGKWCEQGGITTISGNDTTNVIYLKKTLRDYTVSFPTATASSNMGYHTSIYAWLYSNTQLNVRREASSGVGTGTVCWKVEGYIS